MSKPTTELNIVVMFSDDYDVLRGGIDNLRFTDEEEFLKKLNENLSQTSILENQVLHDVLMDHYDKGIPYSIHPLSPDRSILRHLSEKNEDSILKEAIDQPLLCSNYTDEELPAVELLRTNLDGIPHKDYLDFWRPTEGSDTMCSLVRVSATDYYFLVSRDVNLNYIVNQVRAALFSELSKIVDIDSMARLGRRVFINHLFEDEILAA